MGNQPSMSMNKMSARFTLRGLSWRAPRKSLPPLPGEEDMMPPPGPPPGQPQQMSRDSRAADSWDGEASDDGDWEETQSRGSWMSGFKSKRMTQRTQSTAQNSTMRKKMASTMFEASQSRLASERNLGNAGARESMMSEWSTPSEHGPEFKELYDKLIQFYMKHDPDAIRNKEIDISGMTSWCLESEEGSLEELNEKLYDRFGETLDDLDGPRVQSMNPAARANRSDDGSFQTAKGSPANSFGYSDSEEEDEESEWGSESEDDDDIPGPVEGEGQIREELENFFLRFEPESLSDIDDYMNEFRLHGRTGLNVKLFRAFGKNLTTLEQGDPGRMTIRKSSATGFSRNSSVPSPQSMGGTRKQSVRKASKFGVHVAPEEVLGEMRTSSLKPNPLKPSGFPDFTAKRQQKIQETRKNSNVSASLQRKWNHLANRNRGVSTRISTRVSTKFQKPQQSAPAPAPVTPSPVSSKAVVPKQPKSFATLPPKRKDSSCPRFQVNLEGEFGTCKNCGKKKHEHFERKPKLAPTLARKWSKLNVSA